MIIIGYQGIGKSTLCAEHKEYIDLESSSFWIPAQEVNNGEQIIRCSNAKYRHNDWYEEYCNIAEHLSKQGYHVFVSSHEPVRKRLQKSDEIVIAIAPAPTTEMETVWFNKLKIRYDNTGLEKDFKALRNMEYRYKENVMEIFNDIPIHIMLHNPKYRLGDIIHILDTRYLGGIWPTHEDYAKYVANFLNKNPQIVSTDDWINSQKEIFNNSARELNKKMKEFATNLTPNI